MQRYSWSILEDCYSPLSQRGAKINELPVQFPTKFELVVRT
jgi:hypothetical protein